VFRRVVTSAEEGALPFGDFDMDEPPLATGDSADAAIEHTADAAV
jgi:hypothetical protein